MRMTASPSGFTTCPAAFRWCPALVGAFGLAEVITVMREPARKAIINAFDTVIPKLARRHPILAHDHPLRADRHRHRHRAGRGRGRRRLELLCRGAARQQGEGKIRQRFDRRPDGGGDRRQCLRSRRSHSGADARGARLRARGGAARGDADPRRQSGAADHGREPEIRLRRRRHDVHRQHRHSDLRPDADQTADQGPAVSAYTDHAGDFRAVLRRLLRHRVAPVRCLCHARPSA